jgi:hypothetical protein
MSSTFDFFYIFFGSRQLWYPGIFPMRETWRLQLSQLSATSSILSVKVDADLIPSTTVCFLLRDRCLLFGSSQLWCLSDA